MSKIKHYKPIKVKLSELKFDKENPNEMTSAQEEGLANSLTTFGNVEFIVIDQNNLILSGNHRAQKLIDLGEKETFVIQKEFKDNNERRKFSQTMNKLRGQYDTIKDSEQLTKLFEANQLGELADLIAVPQENLALLMERTKATFDGTKPVKVIFDALPTDHICPKCGYKW